MLSWLWSHGVYSFSVQPFNNSLILGTLIWITYATGCTRVPKWTSMKFHAPRCLCFSLREILHGGFSFWLSWSWLKDCHDTFHELWAAILSPYPPPWY